MSMLKLKNKPSRNGFDLSRKTAFTAKAGELLPCFVQHVMPTDHIKCKVSSFTRTQPLQTAAFTRLREYYDFYFVPYRLLWRYAPSFFTQTEEKQFAEDYQGGQYFPTLLPHVKMDDLKYCLYYGDGDADLQLNIFGYNISQLRLKLASYLGYGFYAAGDMDKLSNYCGTLNVQLLNFAAYQKIYFDYFRDPQWEQNNPLAYNFDYQNGDGVVPLETLVTNEPDDNLLTLRYCNYPTDYFMGLLPSPQYGDAAVVTGSSDTSKSSYSANLFFNGMSSADKDNNIATFDYNGVLYGAFDNDYSGGKINAGELVKSNPVTISSDDLNNALKSSTKFTVASLRQAEALQRWREISQPNGKDYPSQMRAHFGSSTPDVLGDYCTYIGGFSSNININDVTNTSLDESSDTVSNEKRAWIKGKGTFVNDGTIDFTAQEHGVIIGMYHVLPLLDYDSIGLDPFVHKTAADDFAIPEFDRIGMQPVPLVELSAYLYNTQGLSKYLGYAPRYAEYKTAVDKVYGAFVSTLKDWYSAMNSSYMSEVLGNDAKVQWYIFKKVNPSILDTIFGVSADGSVDTDPFLINSFFDVKAVRPLDRNGLPY